MAYGVRDGADSMAGGAAGAGGGKRNTSWLPRSPATTLRTPGSARAHARDEQR
jgi:hypothetical protein